MNNIQYPESTKKHVNEQLSSIDAQIDDIDASIAKINVKSAQKEQRKPEKVNTQYLCLHPYLFGIGHKDTLSAQTALQLAGDAISSSPIILNSGLALTVTGHDVSQFAINVTAMANTLSHPALKHVAVLASKKALLPIEKMQIPQPSNTQLWVRGNLHFMEPLLSVANALWSANNQAMSPVERLINISTHQKSRLLDHKKTLAGLSQKFTSQCYAARLSGTPSVMKKQLSDFKTDNQPYSVTLILLSNDTDSLSILYEMFAL
jgi:hypothetical protein